MGTASPEPIDQLLEAASRSSGLTVTRLIILILISLALSCSPAAATPTSVVTTSHRSPQAATSMLATDAMPLPPRLRHITSPAGTYHLVLTAPEAREDKQFTASLFEQASDRCQQVWTQSLPQEYGPRLALVTDTGQTLLLDEWINVASLFAIMVLDPAGQVITRHTFDDIVAVTGSDRADIVAQAEQGFWIAGDPALSLDNQARVPTAGGTLTIDLQTGSIAFEATFPGHR